ASYCSLLQGKGIGTIHKGSPAARACASRSSRRTACMATRSCVSFRVVTRPTTSTSPRCRSTCKAHALSLPLLQLSSVLGFTSSRSSGSAAPELDAGGDHAHLCGGAVGLLVVEGRAFALQVLHVGRLHLGDLDDALHARPGTRRVRGDEE